MQKEHDEPYKRQETEAQTAQAALQRAQTLTERVAAYHKALHSDPRIARLHMLDMTRPLEVTDSYIPLRLHQDTRPGYNLDWVLQEMSPRPHALLRADQRQLERWASYPLAPEQALRMYKQCVIVGDPGTGKTTLLKYLTLQAIDQQLRGLPDLPIHVELRAFARSEHCDLLEFASYVWQERYGFPQAEALDYIQEKLQAIIKLPLWSLPAKQAIINVPAWLALRNWNCKRGARKRSNSLWNTGLPIIQTHTSGATPPKSMRNWNAPHGCRLWWQIPSYCR